MEQSSISPEKKQRNANFELLRILAMLQVVTIHSTIGSGILNTTNRSTINYFFTVFLLNTSFVSVNCYILLTGYFLCRSYIRSEKIFTLYLQVLFHTMLLFVANLFFPLTRDYSPGVLFLYSLFPETMYWFFLSYLMLLVVSPFLNMLINAMNRKQFLLLLGIMIFTANIMPSFGFDLFGFNKKPCLMLFIHLYFTGAFCRNYITITPEKTKHYLFLFILFDLCLFFFLFINLFAKKYYGVRPFHGEDFYFITNYCSSIALFLFFGCIQINSQRLKQVILFLSPLTFGVYLFHENIYLKGFLWNRLIHLQRYYTSFWFPMIIIGIIVGIYVVGSFVDFFRYKLFQMLSIKDRLGNTHLCKTINSLWEKRSQQEH